MPYRVIIGAMRPDAWKPLDGTPWPASIVNEREGQSGRLEYRPPQTDALALALPHEELVARTAEMWQRVASLSVREADTVTILASIWLERARNPKEVIRVSIDELLTRRGLKPKKGGAGRRGGFMPEQRLSMITSLQHVAAIQHMYDSINVFEPDAKGERKKKSRHVTLGRAFLIFEPAGQLRIEDGSLDIDSVRFVPGELLALFFWGPGRQTMQLDAKLLSFDTDKKGPEKALGYYLTGLWRMRSETKSYAEGLSVSRLLQKSGLTLDESRPSRTRERLEKALDVLRDEGIIASWHYESWSLGDAPREGWAKGWLTEKITITPPAWIVTHYAENIEHKQAPALEAPEPPPLTEPLRETRKRLGLTQEEAAEACDMPQQTYSRAERGKGVSAANRTKLEAWLATHALPTQ